MHMILSPNTVHNVNATIMIIESAISRPHCTLSNMISVCKNTRRTYFLTHTVQSLPSIFICQPLSSSIYIYVYPSSYYFTRAHPRQQVHIEGSRRWAGCIMLCSAKRNFTEIHAPICVSRINTLWADRHHTHTYTHKRTQIM